jgi:two-component system LytT family response regulator
MSVKTFLIDDEPLAIQELENMLSAYPVIEIAGRFTQVAEAEQAIREQQPDLIFLDINMPGKSGFDLLEQLDTAPQVIFVTAYDQFAIKAFEVSALDYLLKPVNPDRLAEAVAKVEKMHAAFKKEERLTLDKRIFIKDGDRCFFVPLRDIFLIESVGNYARVFYKQQKPLLHKSLNYLEEKLPDTHFFRASRQHIINLDHIVNIHPYHNSTLQAELQNGIRIDISQRQSARFREITGI